MYLQLNTVARSGNRCCSGKAVSIRYTEHSSLTLGIQHAMRMRHIFICALSDSTFPHYLINGKIFEKKKVIEHKVCFDFTYNFCLKHF